MLRKVAVYRSTKKHRKAKSIVQEINSQESNISSVATLSGSKYSDVYRLMKTPKSTKLIKGTRKIFQMNKKLRPQIYTSMKRCRTACQIRNIVNYILCLVPPKRHITIIICSKVGLSVNLA